MREGRESPAVCMMGRWLAGSCLPVPCSAAAVTFARLRSPAAVPSPSAVCAGSLARQGLAPSSLRPSGSWLLPLLLVLLLPLALLLLRLGAELHESLARSGREAHEADEVDEMQQKAPSRVEGGAAPGGGGAGAAGCAKSRPAEEHQFAGDHRGAR
jgi:hypothetical protein